MRIMTVVLFVIMWAGCGGYGSSSSTPPAPGVVPAIAGLVPDNVDAGSSGFTLTVNGSSFNSDAVVKWNGTSQATTYVSGKQLTAAVAATNVSSSGTASVTVTNPGHPGGGPYGGGGTMSATSSAVTFTIN